MAILSVLPTHCGPYVKADRGCRRKGKRISGKCVDCHLFECLEETPGGIATLQLERRRMLVLDLHGRGASIKTIVNTLRVSERTVFRLLEEA